MAAVTKKTVAEAKTAVVETKAAVAKEEAAVAKLDWEAERKRSGALSEAALQLKARMTEANRAYTIALDAHRGAVDAYRACLSSAVRPGACECARVEGGANVLVCVFALIRSYFFERGCYVGGDHHA